MAYRGSFRLVYPCMQIVPCTPDKILVKCGVGGRLISLIANQSLIFRERNLSKTEIADCSLD